ncbi:MAG TPA: methyltransferase domain-containing protein [Vicinamibacterales bacterium]|nr:methyltransferase domain-containing protein [Vicinamibacterales bacterium]
MDLSELRPGVSRRHPWEIARVRAVAAILRRQSSRFDSILDVGCGDGFVGEHLQSAFGARELVGIDIHLPTTRCGTSHPIPGRTIERYQSIEAMGDRRFDLVLALDVIEHVADDRALLRSVASSHLQPGGAVLVTVPAFQSLFSDHDRALQHYRRYRVPQLRAAMHGTGMTVAADGYMFASLLLPRLLEKVLEAAGRHRTDHGAGSWTRSGSLTAALAGALTLDARVLLAARRFGLRIPGLTAWAFCRPQ